MGDILRLVRMRSGHQKPQHQLTHPSRSRDTTRDTSVLSASSHSTPNGGDGQGMAKVLEALTKINADTERLNQRIDAIEKTTKILSTIRRGATSEPDWQRGLAKAATPSTRSNGMSYPGVPYIELREDREVIVKVGPNREQIRGLSPREPVERAER
ncbi:reverse transcriptase [Penicillium cf. viridicatum]|uniref:Reverse transcriptase n=1 Tax=Penicillium cf. viridicatum TaxID=2972119 RepID=A0A9W9N6Q0_9EURO|nr:reverse transcriptase [Penicillium cf. viridicatum]